MITRIIDVDYDYSLVAQQIVNILTPVFTLDNNNSINIYFSLPLENIDLCSMQGHQFSR